LTPSSCWLRSPYAVSIDLLLEAEAEDMSIFFRSAAFCPESMAVAMGTECPTRNARGKPQLRLPLSNVPRFQYLMPIDSQNRARMMTFSVTTIHQNPVTTADTRYNLGSQNTTGVDVNTIPYIRKHIAIGVN
jgi:hypothetical protein